MTTEENFITSESLDRNWSYLGLEKNCAHFYYAANIRLRAEEQNVGHMKTIVLQFSKKERKVSISLMICEKVRLF